MGTKFYDEICNKIESKIINELKDAKFDLKKANFDVISLNNSDLSTDVRKIVKEHTKRNSDIIKITNNLKVNKIQIPKFKLTGGTVENSSNTIYIIKGLLLTTSEETDSTSLTHSDKIKKIEKILEDEIKLLEPESKKYKIYTIAEINSSTPKVIDYTYLQQSYIGIYDSFISESIKLTETSSGNRLKECLEKFIQIYDFNTDESILEKDSSSNEPEKHQ